MTTYCTQPLNRDGYPVGTWHFDAKNDREAYGRVDAANIRHTPLEKLVNHVYVRVDPPETKRDE